MEIELFESLIDQPNDLINAITSEVNPLYDNKKYLQYDPLNHDVHIKGKRPDKEVFKPTGKKDDKGNDTYKKDIVRVNRLSIPLQKLIVKRKAAFLVGGRIKLQAALAAGNTKAKGLFDAVTGVWRDNKLQFKNKRIAKIMMAECECAELWYTQSKKVANNEVIKLKMMILAPSLGNTLYPVFDYTGDMIAFGNSYEKNHVKYMDVYDAEYIRYFVQLNSVWQLDESREQAVFEHNYGKIPVIYYSQDNPEWWDVQPLIQRLEDNASNHADTNDYNGSPILKLKGEVKGMAAKGEAGKAFQMDKEADISYVTWDNAPESIKYENENLRSWVFGGTQTPDLSPEFLKGLGDISGAALDRILIDAHLAAKDKQDDGFGECIQRRNNFLVSALCSIYSEYAGEEELEILPVFGLFRINDEADRIENALRANGNKPIMSQEESVAYADISDDPASTWDKIKEETDALGNTELD